ncbi:glutaredoxin [Candidatus Parcubacteria bacterium]|uniref:Glutaredoxin n=1 Tax=Candidatus Kaiserbacteria bacterium CG10_big_fil_rev_8_21_14_0_10_47_16 TaxID=1974608 RepID=A0A2H0UEP7_9BACT|nr:glutaredoxin [Candidatus Parcubacteria bacterium]PIR84867.1 MAG: glutaredoxin [Candidatus Kaiserbacteria bacterium CG10_big_fil_rev_8_21_14_0_10_47_16]
MQHTTSKQATLYRMVMPEHTCPYGVKSKHFLETHGFTVIDKHLTSREETDAFKAEHGVDTTPQTFIDGERIGGFDDLKKHFGHSVADADETTYTPVIAIFGVAFLLALAVQVLTGDETIMVLPRFIAIAMVLLALQKLRDVESFSTMFLNYDLLAIRWVPYSYIYPYAELTAGLLMLAGILMALSVPLALFIGTIGAVSVIKAVYIDKRELKCACVGGDTKVPLGFVSLTENLMMVGMALWMLL